MVVVIVVVMHDPPGHCAPDERQPHHHHQDTRQRAQPQLDARTQRWMRPLVRPDDETDHHHQRGVGDGHHYGQQESMPIGAALTDQVSGHHRLRVAGRRVADVAGYPDA